MPQGKGAMQEYLQKANVYPNTLADQNWLLVKVNKFGNCKLLTVDGRTQKTLYSSYQYRRRNWHCIGSMANDNLIFLGRQALLDNKFPVLRSHVQAADHYQRGDLNFGRDPVAGDHFRKVCFLEEKFFGDFIIFLIESSSYHFGASFFVFDFLKK